MSLLKSCQSLCGLESLWSTSHASILSRLYQSLMPWVIIDCIRRLSSRDFIGSVHLPFPILGTSFGVYLTATIQWSIGTGIGPVFQLKVISIICLAIYILSSLDSIDVPIACVGTVHMRHVFPRFGGGLLGPQSHLGHCQGSINFHDNKISKNKVRFGDSFVTSLCIYFIPELMVSGFIVGCVDVDQSCCFCF